jgi:hypothetical protein
VAPLKKQGAGSELRHHIKAFRYLEIAQNVTLDFSFTGSSIPEGTSRVSLWKAAPVSTFEGLTCPFRRAIKARFA